jgi:FxsC-like protein
VPSFFLSSAAGDDDPYVRQLFDDLCERLSASEPDQVAQLAYLGTVGNRDSSVPAEMLLRLAVCDVFVALTSPRYFRTEACGKQWRVFAARFPAGVPHTAIIPVEWAAAGQMPDVVGEVISPTGEHVGRGLRQLIRLQNLRPAYETFVDRLAERISAVGNQSPAPAGEPVRDLAGVDNAFAPAQEDTRVHLILASASRAEMDEVRNDLAYYGSEPADWAPYRPAMNEPLAERARLLAADQSLRAEITSLDDVVERIEQARAAQEIVVILCDWWLTQLDSYQKVLAEIDRRGLGDAAVLVPANRSDGETTEHLAELRFGLRSTFQQTLGQDRSLLRSNLDDADSFDADLVGVLAEARNRLYRVGRASGTKTGERPILRGP